jgi:hypothetical protein
MRIAIDLVRVRTAVSISLKYYKAVKRLKTLALKTENFSYKQTGVEVTSYIRIPHIPGSNTGEDSVNPA